MNSDDITDAFPEVQKWTINMIESISQDKIGPTSTVSCIQFSGFNSVILTAPILHQYPNLYSVTE